MLDFFTRRTSGLKDDLLSGLTVALAMVPEAVAFALIAGLAPLTGLYAALTVGLITAAIGGRPGMISGATGALAVVIVSLVRDHGPEYVFPAVVLMGLIQIAVGLLRLGKLIRLVPHPVMLGFVNGLAIVIFMAQLDSFKIPAETAELDSHGHAASAWMTGTPLYIMIALTALTMAIIAFLPRLTRVVPATLAAIVVTSLLATFALPAFGLETRTVYDLAGSIQGGFPTFDFPVSPMTWQTLLTLETIEIILPYSLILAAVGLIESLMTMSLIDEITQTHGRGNRECIGQGVANITTGMFGGMGGCAMIGQSLINVNSGGRTRVSGIAAALFLLLFIMFLSPVIEVIPMAALVGVMFMVVIGTFEWASLRMYKKIPTSDLLVMITVTAVTVFLHNLALAVFVGVIIAALVFAWQQATYLAADTKYNEHGSKIYQLHGPLFFGSVTRFRELFDPNNDPDDVVIDFYYTRVVDQSGLEAINSLATRYANLGKRLHLTHLSEECRQLLDRAKKFVEVNISEDPHYHVSTDRLD
ncbi:SulP family inorganic anion transporter [Mucisphaera calidilacus]|uniref:Bicarbonate transporter BicA n=1 Tax=Mucisphaera calidilacus TaxID=2527982 RepID=A0A518BXE1_9BACT|nr:SulP family inorganic anion transporter [Mucisphaera calidilacus]QDU71649.1 Bicarbonate transporter BicA [Mucisphaera calidilacus]